MWNLLWHFLQHIFPFFTGCFLTSCVSGTCFLQLDWVWYWNLPQICFIWTWKQIIISQPIHVHKKLWLLICTINRRPLHSPVLVRCTYWVQSTSCLLSWPTFSCWCYKSDCYWQGDGDRKSHSTCRIFDRWKTSRPRWVCNVLEIGQYIVTVLIFNICLDGINNYSISVLFQSFNEAVTILYTLWCHTDGGAFKSFIASLKSQPSSLNSSL